MRYIYYVPYPPPSSMQIGTVISTTLNQLWVSYVEGIVILIMGGIWSAKFLRRLKYGTGGEGITTEIFTNFELVWRILYRTGNRSFFESWGQWTEAQWAYIDRCILRERIDVNPPFNHEKLSYCHGAKDDNGLNWILNQYHRYIRKEWAFKYNPAQPTCIDFYKSPEWNHGDINDSVGSIVRNTDGTSDDGKNRR